MKVNFKRFKSPENVKDFLEKQLPLGITTPDEVFAFLDDLGLRHSPLLDSSKSIHKVYNSPADINFNKKLSLYEQFIATAARARPTLFVLLYFHFKAGKLAEIEVEKVDVSF